jgi:hypothetical protein
MNIAVPSFYFQIMLFLLCSFFLKCGATRETCLDIYEIISKLKYQNKSEMFLYINFEIKYNNFNLSVIK